MVKYFATMTDCVATLRRAHRGLSQHCSCPNWLRDPMSHPQIAGMDLARISDLPASQLRSLVRE